jgi:LmbE family N-acetylglucosaminyl deacetylase
VTLVRDFRNVLAIFPHADDETVNCGGTLRRFASAGAIVTLLLLTAGERGNPAGEPDVALAEIRKREAERAAGILGVSRLIQQDFGDGRLTDRRAEIKPYLAETIRAIAPDLVVTYDSSGIYGHPDHIACTEVLLELKAQHAIDATLWCVALPAGVVRLLQAAGQLRRDPPVDARRMPPSVRIFIGRAVIAKIRAWYAYRSQRGAIAKGWGRLVPMWLAMAAYQLEFFAEVR